MKVKDGSIQESGQKDILGMTLGNPEHNGQVRVLEAWLRLQPISIFRKEQKQANSYNICYKNKKI